MAVLELTLSEFAKRLTAKGLEIADIDWRPALKVCRQLLIASTKENFAGGHDPEGTPWLPLKRPRRNSKGADKPLRNTGLLMGSVTGGTGFVEELTRNRLTVGTNLDYAAIHQFGGSIQRPERRRIKPWVFTVDGHTVFTRRIKAHTVDVPARPFLGFNSKLIGRIENVLTEHAAKYLDEW